MSSLLQQLHFNVQVFVLQIVLFLVLLQVLTRILWRPVLAHIKQRDEEIEGKYTGRENMQLEMENLRAEYQKRIEAAEADARTHIQEVVKNAQNQRETLLAETRAAMEETVRNGVADAARESAEVLAALQSRIEGNAFAVTGAMLENTVEESSLRASIQKNLTQAVQQGTGAAS